MLEPHGHRWTEQEEEVLRTAGQTDMAAVYELTDVRSRDRSWSRWCKHTLLWHELPSSFSLTPTCLPCICCGTPASSAPPVQPPLCSRVLAVKCKPALALSCPEPAMLPQGPCYKIRLLTLALCAWLPWCLQLYPCWGSSCDYSSGPHQHPLLFLPLGLCT